jgi:ATP-dependent DNA helicase RecQ
LLKAFGENAPVCHHCDNCKDASRYFSARMEAQMAMSAILRTSGRFVTRHLINILTGETTEAVKRHAHEQLKTFGVGKDRSAEEWRSIFRQLQATDLIGHDVDDDGRWYVTEQGRRVLTGDADIHLRDPKEIRQRPERIAATSATTTLSTAQQNLLAALKAKRLELARRERAPAYVIFNDRSLIEMAEQRPQNLNALAQIHGVGEHKLARYGREFLDVIAQHRP